METNFSRDVKLFFEYSVRMNSNAFFAPSQKEFISILKDMPTVVKTKKPKAPTIFIIGGVVALRDKLKWYSTSAAD